MDSARILTDGALSKAANSRALKAGADCAVFGSA
jgi:pentose-5-phosphate-3-epimerase